MSSHLKRTYPLALVIVGVALSLVVFDRLPAQMPVHWAMDGQPNGWMPRVIGAFVAPLGMIAIWVVLRVVPVIDPRRENYAKFERAYDITIAAALTLLFAIHVITIAWSLGLPVPIARAAPVLSGVLFLVIGNVMPLARSNFMFGVRTPWTLSNERVWARTHRLAGYTMTAAGLFMIIGGLLLPQDAAMAVIVGSVGAAVIAPVVYSYLTWKREMSQ
ncbi:MAG: SdpI family protein [Gemmatimonadota bacterium]